LNYPNEKEEGKEEEEEEKKEKEEERLFSRLVRPATGATYVTKVD